MSSSTRHIYFVTFSFIFVSLLINTKFGFSHEIGRGFCPDFKPMDQFDLQKFTGKWFAIEKFGSKLMRCVTYTISDEAREPFPDDRFTHIGSVRQEAEIGPLDDIFNVDNLIISKGALLLPKYERKDSANLAVKFNTNILNSESSFIVIDTDYTNSALVCSCQSHNLLFDRINRKSCYILSRTLEYDSKIVDNYHRIVDSQTYIGMHWNFDRVIHDGCSKEYDIRNDRPFVINIEKLIGTPSPSPHNNSTETKSENESSSKIEVEDSSADDEMEQSTESKKDERKADELFISFLNDSDKEGDDEESNNRKLKYDMTPSEYDIEYQDESLNDLY